MKAPEGSKIQRQERKKSILAYSIGAVATLDKEAILVVGMISNIWIGYALALKRHGELQMVFVCMWCMRARWYVCANVRMCVLCGVGSLIVFHRQFTPHRLGKFRSESVEFSKLWRISYAKCGEFFL